MWKITYFNDEKPEKKIVKKTTKKVEDKEILEEKVALTSWNDDEIEENETPERILLDVPNYIEIISKELWHNGSGIKIVLNLIKEWATVPFIARYKKELTWGLWEDEIRDILDMEKKQINLFKAKNTALNWIDDLGKLTPELKENIIKAKTLKEVEEIYKPYKSKKKTKAMLALENGFWVIAEMIKKNQKKEEIEKSAEFIELLTKKVVDLKGKETDSNSETISEWAKEIIASEVNQNAELRESMRKYLLINWTLISKVKTEKALEKLNEKTKWEMYKFDLYKEFAWIISKIKSYQILALNRWENLGILSVKIEKSEELLEKAERKYFKMLDENKNFTENELLKEAFKSGFDTLFKSVENEVRGILADNSEDEAIEVFRKNLKALLLTKPEYNKNILAIDPGYKAGCKMAVLNKLGNPVFFDKYFLFNLEASKQKLKAILTKLPIDTIVIWNWTWSNESVELIQSLTEKEIYIVNESGASVYSASKIAKEEFPDLDPLDRGTVSIARRYIDPLSELVKVPVESIWVGMYQHDMPVKKLEEKLGFVVEDSVNEVGINVNTTSVYVLAHISWIDKRLAKKIYKNRPYTSREELKKDLNDKAFEQAIGFLRIPESENELDNTDIHPLQYPLANYILENFKWGLVSEFFAENKEKITELYPEATTDTINFILDSYDDLWKEKRVNSTHQKAKTPITIDSLQIWDILQWVIRNVLAFWAFVDIWLKNDWLVHISHIADQYVKDPNDVVEVGQKVKVKILSIDEEKGKVQLSMKEV